MLQPLQTKILLLFQASLQLWAPFISSYTVQYIYILIHIILRIQTRCSFCRVFLFVLFRFSWKPHLEPTWTHRTLPAGKTRTKNTAPLVTPGNFTRQLMYSASNAAWKLQRKWWSRFDSDIVKGFVNCNLHLTSCKGLRSRAANNYVYFIVQTCNLYIYINIYVYFCTSICFLRMLQQVIWRVDLSDLSPKKKTGRQGYWPRSSGTKVSNKTPGTSHVSG